MSDRCSESLCSCYSSDKLNPFESINQEFYFYILSISRESKKKFYLESKLLDKHKDAQSLNAEFYYVVISGQLFSIEIVFSYHEAIIFYFY